MHDDHRPAGGREPCPSGRPSASQTALVIEPEAQLRRVLRAYLIARGYRCLDTDALGQGLLLAIADGPALVMLDVDAPGAEPRDAVARIRAETRAHILLVGDQDELPALAGCLDAGADDFLTKPFTAHALDQRLGAIRCADGPPPTAIRIGPLSVDLERRSVQVGSRTVPLSELEYRLLALLVRYPGHVVTVRQIEETLWSDAAGVRANEVRGLMRMLREKLESDPARPTLLRTETGIGYRALPGATERS